MIEPKIFYRKLDFLQNRIGLEKSGKDFLLTIVKQLEQTFGNDLKISNGSIYERQDNEYLLLFKPNLKHRPVMLQRIAVDDPIIQAVHRTKTYIYDMPVYFQLTEGARLNEYTTHVAFTVHSQNDRWIFVFDLRSEWVREEVDLCLNAVRTALNYRLTSESVKSELHQAVQIQQSLLPQGAPDIPGYQIAGFSQPAELVGGDLYDYFTFDEQEFGFCIGDASGHGIPAALMVRDVVVGLRMGIEKEMKMVHTLRKLNSVIYQGVYSSRFISLFYAEMERNGNLFYANAGHPSPLLYNGKDFKELEPTGLIIGAFPEIDLYRAFIHIPRGGVLTLFTDGILERKNKQGELFDVAGVKKVIAENYEESAETILAKIFRASKEFSRSRKWEDDATLLVIKRLAN